MRVTIKKGLDIPLTGKPELTIDDGAPVSTVAALGTDVVGLRPKMSVKVGDRVRLGQTLYVDKRNPGVKFTAPGAGEVIEINRGARRSLQSESRLTPIAAPAGPSAAICWSASSTRRRAK